MSIVDTNETPTSTSTLDMPEKSVRSLTFIIVGVFICGIVLATAVAIWFLLQISSTTVFK